MQFDSDEPQVLETEVTESEPTNTEAEGEEATGSPEEWKAKAEELEKKNRQLYERLKKQEKPPEATGLSEYDILALKNSSITEKEDLDTVKEYATRLNLTIAEALEDKYVKTVLAEKAEERRTARATETKSPRGIAKNTGEDLLRRAEREGEIPTTDADIRAMVEARLERRRKR